MNAAEDVYPWQREAWQQFLDGVARDRLGHALLITGAAGVGLEWFAACQCRRLLTLTKQDRPLSEHLHPDLMWVRKEHPSAGNSLTRPRANILIEQIRALSEYLQYRPTGKRKVAVVELIEECNEQAANALLKSLEEPAAGSHVILLSHAPGRVPATIRSRCVQLNINLPDAQTTHAWLADFPAPQTAWALWLTAGAPVVSARLLTEDVIATFMALDEELASMLEEQQLSWPLIKKLARQSQALVNAFLLRLLLAASGLARGIGDFDPEVRVRSVRGLQAFGKLPYSLLLQDCLAKRRHIHESVNLNHELLLANQFAGWLDVLKR